MHLTFCGAAQTVTGSRHLLTLNGTQLLLDCGLYQGRRKDTYSRNLEFLFQPRQVEAVVLSHAHIDHCGNLPNLVQQGFAGRIHATPATCHLTDILVQDSAHIQEADAAFLNQKLKKGEEPIRPLYTVEQALACGEHLTPEPYDRTFQPVPGVSTTLVDAGHILGSAGVLLRLEEDGRSVTLLFSGDIGRRDLPILRDPVLPGPVDYLVMECTYGDTVHPAPEQAYEQLRDVVLRTFARGGKLIIPAFAVGRTQTLVYYLHQMIDRGDIPRLPIYVDSPLALNVTEIFRHHPETFDDETRDFIRRDPHGQALGFDLLTFTRSVDESKALNDRKDSLIIISASGMAETGRILHHLRHNIGDRRNTILITSWMAPHTLGRRLAEGQPIVRIFGEEHKVLAEVVAIQGMSAHAGKDFLLTYARAAAAGGRLRGLFLVHGEPPAAQAFTKLLAQAGLRDVYNPELGESVEL
ncbi:MAG: MBL fold metallo-hydrolase [Chloroflexota bacterium]